MEPDPLHRVQLRRTGRQGHKVDVGRNDERLRGMPSGAVEDRDGVLVGGEHCSEAVEDELHRRRPDLGEDQREGSTAVGSRGAEQVRERDAPVRPR